MSDENKVAEIVTAVEGVVKAIPIYQDLLQPSMQELGKSLQLVAKSVHVALAPLATLVWGYDRIQNFLETTLPKKLAGVSTEKIISPQLGVAAPAIEALRFTDNDTLRNLYANLLATAMNSDTVTDAHPAFVEIIKSILPDEARIMKLFVINPMIPIVDVHQYKEENILRYQEIITNYSHIDKDAGCENPILMQSYIDNLCRVRLIEVIDDFIADPDAYELLENNSDMENINNDGFQIKFRRKILRLTAFGQQFINACIVEKTERSAPA
jgi:hypothetical protein